MRLRPARLNSTVAILFMIGSACFALGTVPAYIDAVGTTVDLTTFFVGSIFFTTASLGQLLQAQTLAMAPGAVADDGSRLPVVVRAWIPDDRNWLAAITQFPGTLFFNVTTSAALAVGLTTQEQDQQIWRPDFFGSVLFLVASSFAILALGHGFLSWRPRSVAWWISWLNMVGSIAFMASAVGSFVLPSSGDYISVAWANGGTFLGAVCFFLGAALMLPEWREVTREASTAAH